MYRGYTRTHNGIKCRPRISATLELTQHCSSAEINNRCGIFSRKYSNYSHSIRISFLLMSLHMLTFQHTRILGNSVNLAIGTVCMGIGYNIEEETKIKQKQ